LAVPLTLPLVEEVAPAALPFDSSDLRTKRCG
jgi:hypothetical protein